MAGNSAHTSDVLIVGGGLIGCSIALRLAQQNARVLVVERGELGAEASSAGAGMIAPQGETKEADEYFRFCAASRDLYPSFVREVEEISSQAVNFRRDGTLMVALGGNGDLETIFQGQSRASLPLQRLTPGEARRRLPQLSSEVSDALWIDGDYWLDNERLARALAEACRKLGVTFSTHTAIGRFITRNGRVEAVETASGEIRYSADEFVLAAGAWSGEVARSAGFSLPIEPCRGQMLEFHGTVNLSHPVRAGHYYLVPRSDGRIIAGSTMEYAGYEKVVTGEGLLAILTGASAIAPFIRTLHFRRAWAGLRPDTKDHRPILGRGELQNLVFATGHFRNGILLTPITAQVISELILRGSSSLPIDPYSPARFKVRVKRVEDIL